MVSVSISWRIGASRPPARVGGHGLRREIRRPELDAAEAGERRRGPAGRGATSRHRRSASRPPARARPSANRSRRSARRRRWPFGTSGRRVSAAPSRHRTCPGFSGSGYSWLLRCERLRMPKLTIAEVPSGATSQRRTADQRLLAVGGDAQPREAVADDVQRRLQRRAVEAERAAIILALVGGALRRDAALAVGAPFLRLQAGGLRRTHARGARLLRARLASTRLVPRQVHRLGLDLARRPVLEAEPAALAVPGNAVRGSA